MDTGTEPVPKVGILSFRYSRRLFGILLVAVLGGLAVREALKPEGFGVLGHYRVAALDESRQRAPLYQGEETCGQCHEDEYEKHEKDIHFSVPCEDCHGPGREHVEARRTGAPPYQGKIFRNLEQANCLACHRRLMARPKSFPTVEVADHLDKVGVKDKGTPCQGCHSPHEPLFLEKKVSEARLHPMIHPCTDCHLDRKVAARPVPEEHVKTFQCPDCHREVVADYATKPHASLDCGTCHIYHKESEFSGRMFKNANPRFCLMCHQKKPFKEEGRIPLIESLEAHLDDVAESDADRSRRCADCHLEDKIHALRRPVTAAAGSGEAGTGSGASGAPPRPATEGAATGSDEGTR